MSSLSFTLSKVCKHILQNKDGCKRIHSSSNSLSNNIVKSCSISSIFDTPFLTTSHKGILILSYQITIKYYNYIIREVCLINQTTLLSFRVSISTITSKSSKYTITDQSKGIFTS